MEKLAQLSFKENSRQEDSSRSCFEANGNSSPYFELKVASLSCLRKSWFSNNINQVFTETQHSLYTFYTFASWAKQSKFCCAVTRMHSCMGPHNQQVQELAQRAFSVLLVHRTLSCLCFSASVCPRPTDCHCCKPVWWACRRISCTTALSTECCVFSSSPSHTCCPLRQSTSFNKKFTVKKLSKYAEVWKQLMISAEKI